MIMTLEDQIIKVKPKAQYKIKSENTIALYCAGQYTIRGTSSEDFIELGTGIKIETDKPILLVAATDLYKRRLTFSSHIANPTEPELRMRFKPDPVGFDNIVNEFEEDNYYYKVGDLIGYAILL